MLFITYLSLHKDSCQRKYSYTPHPRPALLHHGARWKFVVGGGVQKGAISEEVGWPVQVFFLGAPSKIGELLTAVLLSKQSVILVFQSKSYCFYR